MPEAGFQDLDWTLGFKMGDQYLTCDSFGSNRIVAKGKFLRAKQTFTIEQGDQDGAPVIWIKTNFNNYIACDTDGNIQLSDDKAGTDILTTAWSVESQPGGKWAFKTTKAQGWYFGGSGENLRCFTDVISADRLWTVVLAMHPQVTLENINRKKFLHLNDAGTALTCDEEIPWGDDAVVQITFDDAEPGSVTYDTYNIIASNGKFLSASGSLEAERTSMCGFFIEFQGKSLSFISAGTASPKYVTCLGGTGLAKATKGSAGPDEKFQFGNSYPQVKLTAKNDKNLSVKQGVEVAAMAKGDAELTDAEIFQLEPLPGGELWYIKSNSDKLWNSVDGGITASTPPGEASDSNKFAIKFDNGSVSFAAGGSTVTSAMNSYLKTNGAVNEGNDQFTWSIVNRPRLILRGVQGFAKTMPSGKVICNAATPGVFNFEVQDGKCSIADPATGKFWKIEGDVVSAKGDSATVFFVELFPNSKLKIKTEDDGYITADLNGDLKIGDGDGDRALFEY